MPYMELSVALLLIVFAVFLHQRERHATRCPKCGGSSRTDWEGGGEKGLTCRRCGYTWEREIV